SANLMASQESGASARSIPCRSRRVLPPTPTRSMTTRGVPPASSGAWASAECGSSSQAAATSNRVVRDRPTRTPLPPLPSAPAPCRAFGNSLLITYFRPVAFPGRPCGTKRWKRIRYYGGVRGSGSGPPREGRSALEHQAECAGHAHAVGLTRHGGLHDLRNVQAERRHLAEIHLHPQPDAVDRILHLRRIARRIVVAHVAVIIECEETHAIGIG